MIKIGTTNIGKVNYQGTISKALKGTDLIWEKLKVVFETSSTYKAQLSVRSSGTLKPGKNYRIVSNKPGPFYIKVTNKTFRYRINNNEVFMVPNSATIEIWNSDNSSFSLKIEEVSAEPSIILY